MDAEQTRKAIKVMQAYAEGKAIEFRHRINGEWKATSEPIWMWSEMDYRVKVDPVEDAVYRLTQLLHNRDSEDCHDKADRAILDYLHQTAPAIAEAYDKVRDKVGFWYS